MIKAMFQKNMSSENKIIAESKFFIPLQLAE